MLGTCGGAGAFFSTVVTEQDPFGDGGETIGTLDAEEFAAAATLAAGAAEVEEAVTRTSSAPLSFSALLISSGDQMCKGWRF